MTGIYRFDDVTVEPATFSLTKGGAPVKIEPKALEVLICLIERPDRVVTKQELLDRVWKGTAVTENALTRAIAQIRKVLGDDPESPKYVQTIPTKGYRFVGELGPGVQPLSRPRTVRWKRVVLMASLVVIVIVFVNGLRFILKPLRQLPLAKHEGIDAPPIAARPLAPAEKLQAFPAFSPDGTLIAFTSNDHIYTVNVNGSGETQITNGDDGQMQPSWSPDGKSIAFVSTRRGGIWIAPVARGAPAQLTTFGSRPSWSPDGTEIAFQSGEQNDYGFTAFDALPPSTIWIVNVSSRRAAALTQAGEPAGGHGAPSWRADGKRLVFSTCDTERCSIFTIARDASGLQSLITDSRRLSSPIFASNGRAIWYVLVRYNNSLLLSLPIDADGARTANPVRYRQSGPGVMQHLAMSRDGFRFAWTLVEEASDLYALPIGSGTPAQITRNPTLRTSFPAFSPDGTKIAYSAIAAGDDSGVWIADADGKNAKALSVGPGLKQHTQWSRTGWEVFYAQWRGNAASLFKASMITGRSEPFVDLTHDGAAPTLSPDGTLMAFNRTIEGTTSAWIGSAAGRGLRRLANARYPVWSPDGKMLALQVRTNEGSAVGVVLASGGPVRVLTNERGESWPYAWSPDGKQIAFAGRRDGVWNIWTVSLDRGQTRKLTSNESTINWYRTPAWSPSGDRIVYESGAPRGNVWISEPRVTQ